MSPSELTNTIEQFNVYVHRNEAHFTYIYVYHTNVCEADNIYKNPLPNVISPIFFAIFISLWGSTMTLLTAGALTDHRLPATASNVCTTDARLGSVGRVPPPPAGAPPPNKNPGFADELWHVLQWRVAADGHLVEGCLACRTRAPPAALTVGCGWRRTACVTAQYPRSQ